MILLAPIVLIITASLVSPDANLKENPASRLIIIVLYLCVEVVKLCVLACKFWMLTDWQSYKLGQFLFLFFVCLFLIRKVLSLLYFLYFPNQCKTEHVVMCLELWKVLFLALSWVGESLFLVHGRFWWIMCQGVMLVLNLMDKACSIIRS